MRSEPGEGPAVRLGQGQRAVAQGHHKAPVDIAVVGDLLREVRQHAWARRAPSWCTPDLAGRVMKASRSSIADRIRRRYSARPTLPCVELRMSSQQELEPADQALHVGDHRAPCTRNL